MKFRKLYLYLIYPIATLALACQASLLQENLTYVRTLNHELYFIAWVCGTILALSFGFFSCMKHVIHQKQLKIAVLMMAGLFLIAAFLPYDMEKMPIMSDLHVTLSFISLCGMLGCVGGLLVLLTLNHTHLQIYWNGFLCICVIALGILFYFMKVNSLVEIFVAISTPILLDQLATHLSSDKV